MARSHQQEIKIEVEEKLPVSRCRVLKTVLARLARKVIEVKDNWVNIRATMDTGAARHVMPAEMFPRVKRIARAQQRKLVAAHVKKDQRLG